MKGSMKCSTRYQTWLTHKLCYKNYRYMKSFNRIYIAARPSILYRIRNDEK